MTQNINTTSTPGYGFTPANTTTTSPGQTSFLYPHHSEEAALELIATAQALVNPRGVGIYATDETPEGIESRLAAALGKGGSDKVWSEEEKRERRRRWRECLYETLPTGKLFMHDVKVEIGIV